MRPLLLKYYVRDNRQLTINIQRHFINLKLSICRKRLFGVYFSVLKLEYYSRNITKSEKIGCNLSVGETLNLINWG